LAVPLGLTVASHWLAGQIDSDSDADANSATSWSETSYDSEMEGGNWSQVVSDLATPALLTAGAHYLASSDDESSESVRHSEMVGGNFAAAILKTLDDLIVPLGLMTGSHWLQSQTHNQRGGSVWTNVADLSVPLGLTLLAHNMGRRKSDRDQVGGSNLPIIGDSYLGKWLSDNGFKILSPRTLLPLGLIFILYMAYRRYSEREGDREVELSERPNILDMTDREDLKRYVRRNGIKSLDTDTRFPFALAMGPETFKQYVEEEV
jgi:hypothetical protein